MGDWRDRWRATVFSDVGCRDGLGWEFEPAAGGPVCWTVFRDDSGPFTTFSAVRDAESLPDQADLASMTRDAVADLLGAAGLQDASGWGATNIAAGLMFASDDIVAWEGVEWALESGPDDEPMGWSDVGAARTPFAWLRASRAGANRVVDVYQDDANFGLRFLAADERQVDVSITGSRRPRRQIPLVSGRIERVDVVYDTVVEGNRAPGLLTEVQLHGSQGSLLLIAAEAYSSTEWHLYDESVVALPDPARAGDLSWLPPRLSWSLDTDER